MEINRHNLEKLYIQDRKSCREIGQFFNISTKQIWRLLKKHGIKTRSFSTKGTVGWALGIPKSEETREKLSKAKLGKKLSAAHRERVIKTLNYGAVGSKNHMWKGGKHISPKGYVYLRIPDHPFKQSNGYVPEHRFVLEQHLGRYLSKWEHVHHKNRNKHDNSVDNLELVNAQTHNLITMLENEVVRLTAENNMLKEKLSA